MVNVPPLLYPKPPSTTLTLVTSPAGVPLTPISNCALMTSSRGKLVSVAVPSPVIVIDDRATLVDSAAPDCSLAVPTVNVKSLLPTMLDDTAVSV